MKVCLVTPPSDFLLDQRVFMSLGILKIGAVLEQQGYEVDHLDLTGVSNYTEAASDYRGAEVFAVTATTPQIPAAIKIRSVLSGKVILGGPHATLVAAAAKKGNKRATEALQKLLSIFDCVVAGDGEKAIFRALNEYGFIDADDPNSPLWESSKDFTESPWPARHLVDVPSYRYSIDGEKATHLISQLGCPMQCAFCAGRNSPMLRRIRVRPPDSVIAEILHLHRTYGFKGFNFFDDELNINRSMLDLMNGLADVGVQLGVEWKLRGFIKAELFTEAQARAMYKAGFRWILIGFESGSDRILLNINKKATRQQNTDAMNLAHDNGLKVKALMSLGHPGESQQTADDTLSWLVETKPDELDVTVITPYPGSPYWDDSVEIDEGVWAYTSPKSKDVLYMEHLDFSVVSDYYKGVPGEYVSHVWTDHVSKSELVQLRDRLEGDARDILGIPFPSSHQAMMFDHSMGMTPIILRSSRGDNAREASASI